MSSVVTRGLSVLITKTGVSPVSLSDVKQHLQIDDNDDNHDALLNTLIDSAIEEIEKYCAISIIDSNVTAQWEAIGSEELPYGPIKEIETVTGASLSAIEGLLGSFQVINANSPAPVTVSYKTGWMELPKAIKLGIIKHVTDNFEQRTGFNLSGREALQQFPNDWKHTVRGYRRILWLG